MHGIITMLRALRYDLESLEDDTLIEQYEDTLCNAEDLLMENMNEGGYH